MNGSDLTLAHPALHTSQPGPPVPYRVSPHHLLPLPPPLPTSSYRHPSFIARSACFSGTIHIAFSGTHLPHPACWFPHPSSQPPSFETRTICLPFLYSQIASYNIVLYLTQLPSAASSSLIHIITSSSLSEATTSDGKRRSKTAPRLIHRAASPKKESWLRPCRRQYPHTSDRINNRFQHRDLDIHPLQTQSHSRPSMLRTMDWDSSPAPCLRQHRRCRRYHPHRSTGPIHRSWRRITRSLRNLQTSFLLPSIPFRATPAPLRQPWWVPIHRKLQDWNSVKRLPAPTSSPIADRSRLRMLHPTPTLRVDPTAPTLHV